MFPPSFSCGPTQPPVIRVPGPLPGGEAAGAWRRAPTPPHLVSWLKKGILPPPYLCVFVDCSGVNCTFTSIATAITTTTSTTSITPIVLIITIIIKLTQGPLKFESRNVFKRSDRSSIKCGSTHAVKGICILFGKRVYLPVRRKLCLIRPRCSCL